MCLRNCAAFLVWVSLREFPLVWGQGTQAGTAVQDHSLSGRVFSTDVLFDRDGLSKPRCAALCLRTDKCATFTCTQTAGARLYQCRGYHGRKMPCSPYETSAETRAFVFEMKEDWLDAPCTGDQDCSQPHSVCFKGLRCTCKPGLYYSVSRKACVECCDNLHDTYITYEVSAMRGHTDGSASGGVAACKQACTDEASFTCQNFDYQVSSGNCYLCQDTAAYMDYQDWDESFAGYDNYQRNCQ